MIKLQQWHCVEGNEINETCDTIVYVPGDYTIPPCCPECGNDSVETMIEIGFKYFEEVKGNDN